MAAEYGGNQSAWIKRLVEPSTIDDNFKDGYVDMLANRTKLFSDLSWVLKRVHTPEYKYKHPRGYEQLNRDVLNSDRVKNAVEKVNFWSISLLITCAHGFCYIFHIPDK